MHDIPSEGMTADEFISYAYEVLFGEGVEPLLEQIAEYNSEVAMFGDAGPGMGLRLGLAITEYNRIARRYEYLTGSKVPALPYMRSPR